MKTIKNGEVWAITQPVTLSSLVIEEGGSIKGPEGRCPVMTVNGCVCDIVPGSYQGNILISLPREVNSWCGFENQYRTALLINSEGIDSDASIPSALSGAAADNNGISGGRISLKGDCLNAIGIDGGSYRISSLDIDYQGNGGDDFELWGSAIAVGGDAQVVVDKVNINTRGVITTAVAAAGTSKVLVKDSQITCTGTDNASWHAKHPHLSETPWVLGLRGTLRATNVLEGANVTYYNTKMTCNGWGVLSVDGTKGAIHNMVNVNARIPGDKGYKSGYCAYILGGTTSTFLGCDFDVPDYVFSVGGNENHTIVGPSSRENLLERQEELAQLISEVGLENIPNRPCIINTPRFAGMWHHQSTGLFDIRPGTVIRAGTAAFLIKSGDRRNCPHIVCRGVELHSPVVLHLMESDDPGMGVRTHDKCWAPCGEFFYNPKPLEDFDFSNEDSEGVLLSEYEDMELAGDFYNTKTTQGQNLHLIFRSTTLTGQITSGSYVHKDFSYGLACDKDGNKVCTDKAGKKYITDQVEDLLFGKMPKTYYLPRQDESGSFVYSDDNETLPLAGYGIWNTDPQLLGDVIVTPCPPIAGGIILSLEKGSSWTVTGQCYLSKLIISEDSSIAPPKGKTLKATLNGQPLSLSPGTYAGLIELSLS